MSSLLSVALERGGRSGRVHSVFPRTVNILARGPLWLCLHAPGVPMHPHAVVLERAHAGRGCALLGARAGERVDIAAGEIVLGGGRARVGVGRAAVWSAAPERPRGSRGARPAGLVDTMLEPLGEEGVASPFLGCGRDAAGVEGALARRCRVVREDLAAAWRRGDAARVRRAVRSAVGLGLGLTPSGDDFVVGFLGAVHVLARADGIRGRVLRCLRMERSMTTLPSYFMLRAAMAGLFPEPLTGVLHALSHGDPGRIRASAARLAALGATSGQDMLAGVICYLEAAEKAGGAS